MPYRFRVMILIESGLHSALVLVGVPRNNAIESSNQWFTWIGHGPYPLDSRGFTCQNLTSLGSLSGSLTTF
jgi:hypothetical protein